MRFNENFESMRRRFLTQIVTPYHAPYQCAAYTATTLSGPNIVNALAPSAVVAGNGANINTGGTLAVAARLTPLYE